MSESPDIDFTKIDFPSDGLTIKTLRRLHPDDFDTEPDACHRLVEDVAGRANQNLMTMLDAERFVAQAAFAKASSVQWTPGDIEDAQISAARAATLYVHYGLASGPQHAQQLIRGIETQAAEQARQPPGRGSSASSRGRV
jgi:hypothetical protein